MRRQLDIREQLELPSLHTYPVPPSCVAEDPGAYLYIFRPPPLYPIGPSFVGTQKKQATSPT